MNMGYINTMTANLIAVYWKDHKVRLAGSEIRGNLPEICKIAIKYEKDASEPVRDAAVKLLEVLRQEGVDPGPSSTANIPVSVAPAAPSAPVAPEPKVKSSDWSSFESAAINEAGPMAGRLIQKMRDQHPGVGPRGLREKFDDAFGRKESAAIFSKYHGS